MFSLSLLRLSYFQEVRHIPHLLRTVGGENCYIIPLGRLLAAARNLRCSSASTVLKIGSKLLVTQRRFYASHPVTQPELSAKRTVPCERRTQDGNFFGGPTTLEECDYVCANVPVTFDFIHPTKGYHPDRDSERGRNCWWDLAVGLWRCSVRSTSKSPSPSERESGINLMSEATVGESKSV